MAASPIHVARNPRLALKRKDLAVELRCFVCEGRRVVPVDDILVGGEMPKCPLCERKLGVYKAVPRAS